MATGFRRMLITLHADDNERLRFIAERRGVEPHDLASHLLATWVNGPGREELLAAVLGPPTTTPLPRRPGVARRRRPEAAGQLELVARE